METYVTVSFWLGVLALLINIGTLLVVKFPIFVEESLSVRVGKTIAGLTFTVWAGILLL